MRSAIIIPFVIIVTVFVALSCVKDVSKKIKPYY